MAIFSTNTNQQKKLLFFLFQKLLPQAAPVHGVRAAVDEPAGGAEEVRQECRTPHQSC